MLQADAGGGRPAAHRHQDLVAGELTPVRQRRHHRAVAAHAAGRGHARPGHHGDALGLEGGPQFLAGERLLPREQPLRALEDHHLLAAQALEGLRHLGADGTAAQHEQPSGELLRAGDHPVVPRAGLAQARDRRDQRAGAGGQHDRPGRAEPPGGAVGGLDLDGPFPGQPAGAADQVDAFALQPGQLPIVSPVRGHVVALGEGGRGVELAGDRLGGARRTSRRGQHVTRPDERLGGDAAPVGALTTDQLPLDDGNGEAAVGQAAGRVFAGRARADYHHVI